MDDLFSVSKVPSSAHPLPTRPQQNQCTNTSKSGPSCSWDLGINFPKLTELTPKLHFQAEQYPELSGIYANQMVLLAAVLQADVVSAGMSVHWDTLLTSIFSSYLLPLWFLQYNDHVACFPSSLNRRAVKELLNELHGAVIFSEFILGSGYHKINSHASGVPKTVFHAHDGHYELLIVPFSLFSALTTFQSSPNDIFRSYLHGASVLMSVIETLRGFVTIYEEYNSFPEIFLPISSLLSELVKQDNISSALQENIRGVSELIEKKVDEYHMQRLPLQIRKQKPVPIKLLNPKFEENFVKGRDYDPDRERAERKKMLRQIKREAKGAARELRKDNHFLFDAKEKDRLLLEEERSERYGKARAFLQEQEHAFKSGQLGKGGKRKR